jgi:opacity protein-like surface antigen
MTLRWILLLAATPMLSGIAQAQTTGSPASAGTGEYRVYVEFVAHSAFGNAPSQSYGAEGGFSVVKQLQVFVIAGRTSNVAPVTLGTNAQIIAAYLQRTQNATVSFSAKEPVTFGVAGLKYMIPTGSRAEPYVMGGAGVASVSSDVHFLLSGTDVTSNLASYGVTLGTDLSGKLTKPMLDFGGGVAWPLWKNIAIDFQYRFGRILNGNRGITTQLAGAGLAARF